MFISPERTTKDINLSLQNNTEGFNGSRVHLVGFSLGAQVSGVAGHKYPGVARITGMPICYHYYHYNYNNIIIHYIYIPL